MTQNEQTDRWIKCVSTHGNIRGVAIQATHLVQSISELHQLSEIGAKGLGESIIGGLLISSFCKGGERINLNVRGSGHYQQALVDAYPNGTVRAYLSERPSEEILKGKKQDSGPWGSGLISVLRTKDGESKQPYIGTVPMITGHLAKDLSFYWVQSEQIPSAVGLVTQVQNGRVVSAGGFLVQAMPGATSAEIATIESHIHELHGLPGELIQNSDPIHLLSKIFQSTAFIIVEEKPLKFVCNCSWDRVERALTLVGPQELKAMLAEDHQATVKCDFCTKEYLVDAAKLEQMISSAEGN